MTSESPAPSLRNGYIRVLSALGLDRPELRAWAMYDWANSAMVTTIIAAVFPVYFSAVAAKGMDADAANQRYALASTIGMIISAVISPPLGALADTRPWKKPLLGAFLAVGLAAVAGMFFIHTGDWVLASLLFIVANIGANGSFVFYDSLLPHLAREDEIDRVSTAGYALGYVGGGILLALNLLWISKPGWFGLPSGPDLTESQATLPARLAFLSVAVWWGLFAIPLFRKVPEPATKLVARVRDGGAIRESLRQLGETFSELRRFRHGALMLAAFLIYNDGIGTIFRMATIYGKGIGIESNDLILALLIVQFVGIPCAFAFGSLAGKIGAKRAILLGLGVYVGICILGYRMTTAREFYLLAGLVGLVQGGTQALSRSLFASLIPKQKSGEFFGFFAVVEKFAGILGPAVFFLSIELAGSSRVAVIAVIAFFLVGGALLLLVDVPAGQAEARAAEMEDATGEGEAAPVS